jgi:hypothetical protein
MHAELQLNPLTDLKFPATVLVVARLPDRFDLWVRRARQTADAGRQLDWVLGAMVALPEWYFLNIGTAERPQLACDTIENIPVLLVFTDAGRLTDLVPTSSQAGEPATVTIPAAAALAWCVDRHQGLLVNAGDDSVLVPPDALAAFHREWLQRRATVATGFWIPHATSEEEDFWQEHGL